MWRVVRASKTTCSQGLGGSRVVRRHHLGWGSLCATGGRPTERPDDDGVVAELVVDRIGSGWMLLCERDLDRLRDVVAGFLVSVVIELVER